MMASRMPTPEKPWNVNYAIMLKPPVSSNMDGRPTMIGIIGTPRNQPLWAEVGYGLHPDYWGKGYASEALKLFIELYWAPGSTFSTPRYLFEKESQHLPRSSVTLTI